MTALPSKVDLAVVGAGTAGAAVAARAAERGMRVLLVDVRPLEEAGARWVNAVPDWAFDEADVARPTGPERRVADVPFHMAVGWNRALVTIRDHGVIETDMRLLVARLQARAAAAGAVLASGVRALGVDGAQLRTDGGAVEAGAVVDASGIPGARLLGQPPCPRDDLCAAAQEVREVADRGAAEAFFTAHGVPVGATLCFTGVAGGYSILNARLEDDHVSLLSGSIPSLGHATGQELIDRFVARERWIGRRIFGGQRAVPLAAPVALPARGRVASIGDAARQVFAAHGSGIGLGLVAARLLVDALLEGGGPERYAVEWHRRYGALLSAYDGFRRFSQSLRHVELEWLLGSGVLEEALLRAGLRQRFPALDPRALPRVARALLRPPSATLVPRLLRVLARMGLARALYPRTPEPARRGQRYGALVERLLPYPPG